MALTPDASATIEQLHAEVKASGTPEQQALADEILDGYKNVGLGLKLSLKLHHDAMRKLLEDVDLQR
jgi:hypothetical protein